MQYSDEEEKHWNQTKEMFAPGGKLDAGLVRTYLNRCVQLSASNHRVNNDGMLALGALLKRTDLGDMLEPFALLYEDMVSLEYGHDVQDIAPLEQWTRDMAQARPQDLQRLLAYTVQMTAASDTHGSACSVLALESLGHHFPQTDINDWLPAAWKVSPPNIADTAILPGRRLQRVARFGARLMHDHRPAHQRVGQAFVLLAFFNMCTEPSPHATRHQGVNTNVQEALQLLADHAPQLDASQYFDRVRAVTKSDWAVWDGLGYCARALSTPGNEQARNAAQVLAHSIVQEPVPQHSFSDAYVYQLSVWLASVHAHSSSFVQHTIEDWLYERMHCEHRFFELGARAWVKNKPMFERLVQRMQAAQTQDSWSQMLVPLALGLRTENGAPLELNHYEEDIFEFFVSHVSPDQFVAAFRMGLNQVRSSGDLEQDLNEWMPWLNEAPWSGEQIQALRQSGMVVALSLWYLYEMQNWPPQNENINGLPQVQWFPFPLLNKVYPEHAAKWRAMQCEVLLYLERRDENTNESLPIWRDAFENVASLLQWPMRMDEVAGIIDGLGVASADYFLGHRNLPNNVVASPHALLELPKDLVSAPAAW